MVCSGSNNSLPETFCEVNPCWWRISEACHFTRVQSTKRRDRNDSALDSPGFALYSGAHLDEYRMAMERDSFNATRTPANSG